MRGVSNIVCEGGNMVEREELKTSLALKVGT